MPLISIVVPVYHNEASLPALLTKFQELAARWPAERFEFVFVDDGSRDRSFAVLSGLLANEPRMRVIKLSRNFGSNPALLAGLDQAQGDAVVAIAADLQDPPELIDEMLAHWRDGRKVVLAARKTRDDPGLTSLMADVFYRLFRRFAIPSMPKGGFDFFLIDRQVCELIKGIREANVYLMGLILWLGFDPAVVSYHRRQREQHFGRSMWTFAKKLKYFVDSFVAFSYAPIRAAAFVGFLLSVAGILYAGVVLGIALTSGSPVQGWASLMVVFLVVSGIQLILMAIQGEYLWRNLDETRRRPRFIIERIVAGSLPAEVSSETREAA